MNREQERDQSREQNQKKHDAYDLRAVFDEIELDLINNLRRNMKHHEKEEEKEGFRWEMWQKAKLRSIWNYRKKNREIVEGHSRQIERIINETLQGSFDDARELFDKMIKRLGSFIGRSVVSYPKDLSVRELEQPAKQEEDFFGVNEEQINVLQETAEKPQKPSKQPKPLEAEKISPKQPKAGEEPLTEAEAAYKPKGEEKVLSGKDNDRKLDDLKEQVNKDMEKVQCAIWRRMDDIYRQTVYKAELFMAAGAKTLDQAIDMAAKEFLAAGIDCIEYKNGRRVNVASYAQMALRTASQRAAFLAEGKKRDEWGIHTIFVSAHANTCSKCEPWQGKVLVDDVFSSGTGAEAAELGVALLSTAVKAGLLHPNCRHTLATYFPDITILPKVPDKDEAIGNYEAEQKQRALERAIRKAKRRAAGACDADQIKKAQAELEDAQRQMKEHMRKNPQLRRQYNREKIYETAKKMPKKAVEKDSKTDIIRLPRYKDVVIPEEKFSKYALDPNKDPDKSKAFKDALGYDLTNYRGLVGNIRSHLSEYEAVKKPDRGHGQRYEVVMELTGPNGKTANVLTAWIDDNKNGEMRLTTAHIDRRRNEHKDV